MEKNESSTQSLSRTTDEEWSTLVSRTEDNVKIVTQSRSLPRVDTADFCKTIDHTLLKLDARASQFDDLCAEARANGFATVCVRPEWVSQCVGNLEGSGVKVATVVAFHEGTYDLPHKLRETELPLRSGAAELDIVVNYVHLQAAQYSRIYAELAALRAAAPKPVCLKLILETSQLSRSRIVAGCVLASAAGFDFVKTSTGFNGRGATVDDVRLMAACCDVLAGPADGGPGRMQVKASGGIRSLADAVGMLGAGASRLGTSGGVGIAREAGQRGVESVSPPQAEKGQESAEKGSGEAY